MNKNDYELLYTLIEKMSSKGHSIDIFLKNNQKIRINFPKDDRIGYSTSISHSSDSQIISIHITSDEFDDKVYINLNEIVMIREHSYFNFNQPGIYINENK